MSYIDETRYYIKYQEVSQAWIQWIHYWLFPHFDQIRSRTQQGRWAFFWLTLTGLQDGCSGSKHQITSQHHLKARREKVSFLCFKNKQNFPKCSSLVRIVTCLFLNQLLARDKELSLLAQWFSNLTWRTC